MLCRRVCLERCQRFGRGGTHLYQEQCRRKKMERVLAACYRDSAHGLRERTIVLLLARLGLRAGEVIRLRVEDIDWCAGAFWFEPVRGIENGAFRSKKKWGARWRSIFVSQDQDERGAFNTASPRRSRPAANTRRPTSSRLPRRATAQPSSLVSRQITWV